MAMKFKIRKGDKVVVITGKDKGKTGEVTAVLPKEARVVVQGVNIVRRHQRQTAQQQGGIITKEAPIHISNVAHVDPNSEKPTRVGYRTQEDGRKIRVAKRSGAPIDV